MNSEEFSALERSICVLEHQDMLVNMQINAYPHMKKESASKLHKEVYKKAFPDDYKEKHVMTIDQAEQFLKRMR